MTQEEIEKRKTFAIISHPDAGKTTVTEKLLLLGKAIQLAGTVKGKKTGRYAASDWMELEKQRGISVTTSVMQFPYRGLVVNLLDTPGHEDFSEDTYRTLTAVDSVLMVIDGSKGVEDRTIKLMDVSEKYFETLNVNNGINSIDTISGLSSFHSSYMNIIQQYANKYQVDPRKLIISVCNYNQIDAPIELVEREAKKLASYGLEDNWKWLYNKYFGSEQN